MKLTAIHHEMIKNNPLFKDLEQADLLTVIEHTSLCRLKSGEILFRQQQPACYFFLLVTGKVKISLLSSEGSEKVIDLINEGNTFAEAIIFRDIEGYPVNAETLTDSHILRIDAAVYKDILRKSPKACFMAIAGLSQRLHWLMGEIDRLTLHNASYRLVNYLLEGVSRESTERTKIYLSAPKHVIASRLSVTPETFSRILKNLSVQKLLKVHKNYIIIENPMALHQLFLN